MKKAILFIFLTVSILSCKKENEDPASKQKTEETTDPNQNTDTTSVAINEQPIAKDDVTSTLFNTSTTISVLINDTDPNSDELTLISVGDATNGTVEMIDNQTIKYTPNPQFLGNDEFTYTISDGTEEESSAKVIMTVKAPQNVIFYNDIKYLLNGSKMEFTMNYASYYYQILAKTTDPSSDKEILRVHYSGELYEKKTYIMTTVDKNHGEMTNSDIYIELVDISSDNQPIIFQIDEGQTVKFTKISGGFMLEGINLTTLDNKKASIFSTLK